MLIIRRLNYILAASGIVILSQWPSGAQVEREMRPVYRLRENSVLSQPVHRTATESDDTRCCINTIQPPNDEHIMLQTCRGL